MGRHSSSESDYDYKLSKKKRKHRSRSRSISSDNSRQSSRKSKKSKKKTYRKTRSRSRSSEYRRRRSRSRGHRSRSRGRRSRSRSTSRYKSRRSRSRSRRRSNSRSIKSDSRSRRSDSRSRRSNSRSRRSNSRSKSCRQSRSPSKNVKSSNSLGTKDILSDIIKSEKVDPCANVPGFDQMSATEQNEIRLKMALKAAAETDARLREQGVLVPQKDTVKMLHDDSSKRQRAILDIEGDSFAQQSFVSNKSQKIKTETADDLHEAVIFGSSSTLTKSTSSIKLTEMDSLLGRMFYEDTDAKWQRWVEFLKDFRRKKIEGEILT